ncbi:MAG: AIM24 family protein, partial [Tissierellia bacterium]|nr:AIM24 family protein [Tissierellia bacterium]
MKYSIVGDSLPAVIIELGPGETIVSQAGGRTWSKGPITTKTTSEGGMGRGIGRLMSGESLFMSRYTAQGQAEIAFSSSFPGRIVARELAAGESIICQKTAFLCASYGVELAVYFQKKLGAGLMGGEGFVMQRITGPGIVFLEVDGYCQEYDLEPGEKITCDTGALAIMDETCEMDIQRIKGIKNIFFGGEGLFDTVITGPGKVYIQTMTVQKL